MSVQRLVGNPDFDYERAFSMGKTAYGKDLLKVVDKIVSIVLSDDLMFTAFSYAYEYTRRMKPGASDEEVGKEAVKIYFREKKGSTLEDVFFWGVAYTLGGSYLEDVKRQKRFQFNNPKRTVIPDFTWDHLKLVVECDGEAYHSTPEQLMDDREKTKLLNSRGYVVVRYSTEQLTKRPEETFANFQEIYKELKQRRS